MILPLILAINTLAPSVHDADIFVGTYTVGQASKGIYRIRLNMETGVLSAPVLAAETVNPSYLALDSHGRFLFSVNESGVGEVSSFSVGRDLSLKRLSTRPTLGDSPCHLSVSPGGKSVLVANYGSGNLVSLPILPDGSLQLAEGAFQNTGKGPNQDRQEGPHMHDVFVEPKARFAVACDLGTDEILSFPFSKETGRPVLAHPHRVKSPAGSGPRHAVCNPAGTVLYVDNELLNTVSVFEVTGGEGEMAEIQNITSLPEGVGAHQSKAAEIVLHPSGNWLYVSNRGHDSIAQYAVGAGGRLKLLDVFRLGVHEPRGFAIDPSGKWLVVGGQHSNNLASLEIDPRSGALKPEKSIVHLPAPVCVLFAKP